MSDHMVAQPATALTERAARVLAARKLTRRVGRESTRSFLAEGPQAVREALALTASSVAGATALARHPDLVESAGAAGVPVRLVTDRAAAGLSETSTPQGLVAVCDFIDQPLAVALTGRPGLVAVLADVRDPGNVGTVLRSADAAGAAAVVLAGDSADPYNGKAVRASAGSLFHLPVVRGASADQAIAAARRAGLAVLAAVAGAETDLDDLLDAGALRRPTAWLFGNEAHGLPDQVAAGADARVRIGIYGRAESLNLAAAAVVCLYASARAQRRRPADTAPGVTIAGAPR